MLSYVRRATDKIVSPVHRVRLLLNAREWDPKNNKKRKKERSGELITCCKTFEEINLTFNFH